MFASFGAITYLGGKPAGTGIYSVGPTASANSATGTGSGTGSSSDITNVFGSGISITNEVANELSTPLNSIAQASSAFPVAPAVLITIAGVLGGGALLLYALKKRSRK